jgi:hypothetical protein
MTDPRRRRDGFISVLLASGTRQVIVMIDCQNCRSQIRDIP